MGEVLGKVGEKVAKHQLLRHEPEKGMFIVKRLSLGSVLSFATV